MATARLTCGPGKRTALNCYCALISKRKWTRGGRRAAFRIAWCVVADRTWITVAVVAAIALGQSDTGNESQLGRAGGKITNGAAAIASKASSAVSNPGLPSQPAPDVSAAPTGAPTSTSTFEEWYQRCLVEYSGNDMSSGKPRKSPGQCKTWAAGKVGG